MGSIMKNALLIALACLVAGCDENATTPTEAAKAYAKALGLPLKGVVCTGSDTDSDGYVTCSITIEGDNTNTIHSIQCAVLHSLTASGCKPTPVLKGMQSTGGLPE